MFVGHRNIIESEASNVKEVMSFVRKAINKISSSSSSNEDAYESEDLAGILEELVVEEDEELTSTNGSLDNI